MKNKNSGKKQKFLPRGPKNAKQNQVLQELGQKRLENGKSIFNLIQNMQPKDKKQRQEEQGGNDEANE